MTAFGMSDDRVKIVPISQDVEHIDLLSDNIGALFMQEHYSDVTLLVDTQHFPAHKVVLAARSEYFRQV
jgi:BTB/POZ domain-containing protein 9